jgi:phosphate transport system permease protein
MLVSEGWPAIARFGTAVVASTRWDPVAGVYGAAAAVVGTIVSSALALAIATPLALGVAVFTAELAPRAIRAPVAFAVELLAAVPGVVYGLWGIYVLVPVLRERVMPFLSDTLGLGASPLFAGPLYGRSMLAAALLLAIMMLPFIAAVSREVLLAVPRAQREAALALGATRWEMVTDVVLPYARSGIVGAVMLGLGRALGETMAVTMVIGNSHDLSTSLLAPAYSMAALIANEFGEATDPLHLSALMAVGAALFALTLLVNAVARWLVWRVRRAGAE